MISLKIQLQLSKMLVIISIIIFILTIITGIISQKTGNQSVLKQEKNMYTLKKEMISFKESHPAIYLKVNDCTEKNIYLLKNVFNSISINIYNIATCLFFLIIQQIIIYRLIKEKVSLRSKSLCQRSGVRPGE